MKFAFLFAFLFLNFAGAQSSDFPIPRLKGLYTYQNHYEVAFARRAETVAAETTEGQKRLQELRSEGYSCIHSNPTTRLCTKKWKPDQNPEGMDASVQKFMASVQVEFEGGSKPAQLVQDGSTSQEWEVVENVKVLQTQVPLYHVVRYHDGRIFVAFPVNENQPMNPLQFFEKSKLGLTVMAQIKDTPTSTLAYSIEAYLESEPEHERISDSVSRQ